MGKPSVSEPVLNMMEPWKFSAELKWCSGLYEG